MSADAEAEIHQIWEWIRDEGNAGPQNMLQAILSAVRGGYPLGSGKNNFHWLGDLVTTAVGTATEKIIAAINGGAKLDPAQVRAAIEGVTAAEIAKAVADEEDRRARDSNPATGPVS